MQEQDRGGGLSKTQRINVDRTAGARDASAAMGEES